MSLNGTQRRLSQMQKCTASRLKRHQKGRNTRKLTDRDTMRPSYDFSRAIRGVPATRYAQGANVVVVDPGVLDVFPDGAAVNEALRALAPVLRQQRRPVVKRRR